MTLPQSGLALYIPNLSAIVKGQRLKALVSFAMRSCPDLDGNSFTAPKGPKNLIELLFET